MPRNEVLTHCEEYTGGRRIWQVGGERAGQLNVYCGIALWMVGFSWEITRNGVCSPPKGRRNTPVAHACRLSGLTFSPGRVYQLQMPGACQWFDTAYYRAVWACGMDRSIAIGWKSDSKWGKICKKVIATEAFDDYYNSFDSRSWRLSQLSAQEKGARDGL
jgi:hypothetical protein